MTVIDRRAGISGLAARWLHQVGIRVQVFEATAQIAARSCCG